MTTASERLLFLFENSLLENREFGLNLVKKAIKERLDNHNNPILQARETTA